MDSQNNSSRSSSSSHCYRRHHSYDAPISANQKIFGIWMKHNENTGQPN